jgi:hypothetical protein
MPIFVNYFSLVVPKDILEKKYPGGVTQFKKDFSFTECDAMTEDDELLAIYSMGYPYENVETLVSAYIFLSLAFSASSSFNRFTS